MTRVILYRAADGLLRGFEMQGHADFADRGEDIICAAISAISQTAMIALFDREGLALSGESHIDEGYLRAIISEKAGDIQKRDANIVLNAMRLGLVSLQQTYGEYIKIEDRRCK